MSLLVKGIDMSPQNTQHPFSEGDLQQAQQALAKLPILGPALWLYAKDPLRKYTFIADTDWSVMPPIIVDQCRLYSRSQIPFAFVTWAKVSEEVHQRLLLGQPKIAPHEWQSGSYVWLMDIVAPFGHLEETIQESLSLFPNQRVHGFVPNLGSNPPVKIMAWDVPANG